MFALLAYFNFDYDAARTTSSIQIIVRTTSKMFRAKCTVPVNLISNVLYIANSMCNFFSRITRSQKMSKMSIFFTVILCGISSCSEAAENHNEAFNIARNYVPKYVCPAESKSDIKELQNLSKVYFALRYCLFDNISSDHPETCQTNNEFKPVFLAHWDHYGGKPVRCGYEGDQLEFFFGYFYCGKLNELDKLRIPKGVPKDSKFYIKHPNLKNIGVYDVCYQPSKKETIYTTHTVLQGSLNKDKNFKQVSYKAGTISTDEFNWNLKSFFSKLKNRYKSEEKKNPATSYQMLPYPLVPAEHFYIREFQNTTKHYINIAPLWEKLIPLMTAIDQGIKKASLKTLQTAEPTSEERLLITTRVMKFQKPEDSNEKFYKRISKWMTFNSFEPNIWYKYIENKTKHQGVMIYIHNTPGEKIVKKCSDETEIKCNFIEWADTKELWEPTASIYLHHAYCCQVTPQDINEIFYFDADVKYPLDINSLIITPNNFLYD